MPTYKHGDKVAIAPSGIKKLKGSCATYHSKIVSRRANYLIIKDCYQASGDYYYSWTAYNNNDEEFDSCSGHELKDNDLYYYDQKPNASTGTLNKIMNKVLTFVKNATLSVTDKLLRKHGLQDDCGNVTEDAKTAILLNFYNNADNQAYLITIAQGLDAEEVATK